MTDKDDIKWLVKDKFKDDEEGRAAMALAYGKIQSRAQKAEDANALLVKDVNKLKPLENMGKFINGDEATLQFIKRRMAAGEKAEPTLVEPVMPDNYDSLDIGTKGTDTYKYHQDVRKYDRAVAKLEAKEGFDSELTKIRAEISTSGKESKATEDLHKALAKRGYDEKGIADFEKFVKDLKPDEATETLISLHKLQTGDDVVVPLQELQILNDKGFPLANIIPGVTDKEKEPNEAADKEIKDAMRVG